MIDVRELRIGNWVYNQTIGKYMQVYPMMIPQLHRIKNENGSLDNCNIKPIPLTEEILLKAGFSKVSAEIKGVGIFPSYVLNGIRIVYFCGLFLFDTTYRVNVKHLSQLQNLYFALTGKELKIEL